MTSMMEIEILKIVRKGLLLKRNETFIVKNVSLEKQFERESLDKTEHLSRINLNHSDMYIYF